MRLQRGCSKASRQKQGVENEERSFSGSKGKPRCSVNDRFCQCGHVFPGVHKEVLQLGSWALPKQDIVSVKFFKHMLVTLYKIILVILPSLGSD